MPEDEIVPASDLVTIKSDASDKDAIRSAEEDGAPRSYKKRWLMLLLYAFFGALVASQWVQYGVISGIITRYYDVPAYAVDCSRALFLLSYVLTVLPVSQASERLGLKWTLLLGSALCCAGAWVKTCAVAPGRFYVAMIGQTIASCSLVILQTTPGRVAARWFPPGELSTATSLGICGAQLGAALTYLLTPITVLNHDTLEELSGDLEAMYKKTALAASLNLMLMAIVFQQEPERPTIGGDDRVSEKNKQIEESCTEPYRRLFANRSFLLLCNSHGLNAAGLAALGAVMGPLFELHFEDSERDGNKANVYILLTGAIGLIAIGVFLDKTRNFKETAVKVYFCILCGQVAFAVAMIAELRQVVFAIAMFLGFFMSACAALSYELAAELTHPEAESRVAGLLNVNANLLAAAAAPALGRLVASCGELPVYALLGGVAFAGFMLATALGDERRRQDALAGPAECRSDEKEQPREQPKVVVVEVNER